MHQMNNVSHQNEIRQNESHAPQMQYVCNLMGLILMY